MLFFPDHFSESCHKEPFCQLFIFCVLLFKTVTGLAFPVDHILPAQYTRLPSSISDFHISAPGYSQSASLPDGSPPYLLKIMDALYKEMLTGRETSAPDPERNNLAEQDLPVNNQSFHKCSVALSPGRRLSERIQNIETPCKISLLSGVFYSSEPVVAKPGHQITGLQGNRAEQVGQIYRPLSYTLQPVHDHPLLKRFAPLSGGFIKEAVALPVIQAEQPFKGNHLLQLNAHSPVSYVRLNAKDLPDTGCPKLILTTSETLSLVHIELINPPDCLIEAPSSLSGSILDNMGQKMPKQVPGPGQGAEGQGSHEDADNSRRPWYQNSDDDIPFPDQDGDSQNSSGNNGDDEEQDDNSSNSTGGSFTLAEVDLINTLIYFILDAEDPNKNLFYVVCWIEYSHPEYIDALATALIQHLSYTPALYQGQPISSQLMTVPVIHWGVTLTYESLFKFFSSIIPSYDLQLKTSFNQLIEQRQLSVSWVLYPPSGEQELASVKQEWINHLISIFSSQSSLRFSLFRYMLTWIAQTTSQPSPCLSVLEYYIPSAQRLDITQYPDTMRQEVLAILNQKSNMESMLDDLADYLTPQALEELCDDLNQLINEPPSNESPSNEPPPETLDLLSVSTAEAEYYEDNIGAINSLPTARGAGHFDPHHEHHAAQAVQSEFRHPAQSPLYPRRGVIHQTPFHLHAPGSSAFPAINTGLSATCPMVEHPPAALGYNSPPPSYQSVVTPQAGSSAQQAVILANPGQVPAYAHQHLSLSEEELQILSRVAEMNRAPLTQLPEISQSRGILSRSERIGMYVRRLFWKDDRKAYLVARRRHENMQRYYESNAYSQIRTVLRDVSGNPSLEIVLAQVLHQFVITSDNLIDFLQALQIASQETVVENRTTALPFSTMPSGYSVRMLLHWVVQHIFSRECSITEVEPMQALILAIINTLSPENLQIFIRQGLRSETAL